MALDMASVPKNSRDEYELIRRERETRNEAVITTIRAALLAVIVLGNLLALLFPDWLAVRTKAITTISEAGAMLASLGLLAYLRTDPPYRPLRKYLIITCEALFFLLTFYLTTDVLKEQALYFFPLVVYAMLIVLSGLRYSTRAVVYTGVLTLACHLVFLLSRGVVTTDLQDKTASLFGAVTCLSAITIGTRYQVASMIEMARDSAQREWLSRFLAPELVDLVARNPDILQRQTELRTATVLFTDIRGFTTLSERLSPQQVVDFLNLFLDEVTEAIFDNQGWLDKYIGDAAMGVFGVPPVTEDHARRALKAALRIKERMEHLNARLTAQGLPTLSCGVGLHTGELVRGSIGSSRRLDFTVVGDTVNLASRLEAMTRQYPVFILLSESTRAALGDTVPLHAVATVQVKNRVEPVNLWTPDDSLTSAELRSGNGIAADGVS